MCPGKFSSHIFLFLIESNLLKDEKVLRIDLDIVV